MSIGFDRLPLENRPNPTRPELFLDGPPRLTKKPGGIFDNYALLLEPGAYALTSFHIKVARSVSDVSHLVADRTQLIEEGKPKGGFFEVKEHEVVYIGNFYLDCHETPTLWRYYTEGSDEFKSHMVEVKQKYSFIPLENVKYRLFQTTTLGRHYELQN